MPCAQAVKIMTLDRVKGKDKGVEQIWPYKSNNKEFLNQLHINMYVHVRHVLATSLFRNYEYVYILKKRPR